MNFFCEDRLSGDYFKSKKYHMIITNPPYIKQNEDRDQVHPQVLNYEPEIALFLEDDLYKKWYTEFFQEIQNALLPNGIFLLEGHERHLESLGEILKNMNFKNIKIFFDLSQRRRYLLAYQN